MCTMLDIRNAAVSVCQMSDVSHIPEVDEDLSSTSSQLMHTETQGSKTAVTELRDTNFSVPGRPNVSVQGILATYHALKSGVEIDTVDPTPAWPHTLFSATVPSPPPIKSSTTTPKPSSLGVADAMPAHIEETISRLQRENLLLRNELNYELWLKRENVKRIGRLYEDRIIVKGAEVERQGLVGVTWSCHISRHLHITSTTNCGSTKARCTDCRRRSRRNRRVRQPPTLSILITQVGCKHD